MAKITPAAITYTPVGQAQTVLRFHAVVSEAHQAVSEVTKFPVQSGYEISNNVIRKNRILTIEGIITNLQMAGAKYTYNYSETDNAKAVFEAMESLVNTGTPCEVVTNLGRYNPVVFTKFSTKQAAGLVDSMHFTISGEELQIATNINSSGPKVLPFVPLSPELLELRKDALEEAGFDLCNDATITEANIDLGSDFIIDGVNDLGLPNKTTYIANGIDSVTGSYNYSVHVSDVAMYVPEADKVLPTGGDFSDVSSSGGFSQVSSCLTDSGAEIIEEASEDFINTAMGDLVNSGYGALYDTILLSGDDYGQSMIHSGVGCFVRGLSEEISDFPYQPGEALPSTSQILEGARKYGANLFGRSTIPVTENEKEIAKKIEETTLPKTTITQVQC